jgi:2-hydroxy-3-keto-5-methylthiopentenyl-1-phosphate phosphatase
VPENLAAPPAESSRPPAAPRGILVSDFDGTMTRHDFYDLVRKQWPLPPGDDPWEQYVAGRITHFEALAAIFARIRTDEATLLALVDRMETDPALPGAAQRLADHGWKVVVASAGCEWYLRRLLRRAGLAFEIHANPGEFSPATGLQMRLPEGSRFFRRSTGIDKTAVVRDALRQSDDVAFAGDGRPDLEPARLVAPERRFARGWLADALRRQGEVFQAFENWSEIADRLLNPPSRC